MNPARRSLFSIRVHPFPAVLFLYVRQVVDEERRFFIQKLSVTLRGARPRALHGAACKASERVRRTGCFRPAINQQNPLKPGGRELPIPTTVRRACPSWRGQPNRWQTPRQKEPRQYGSGRGGRKTCGGWFSLERWEPGVLEEFEHQPSGKPARPEGRIPHGV
jgi:hypothetical protein